MTVKIAIEMVKQLKGTDGENAAKIMDILDFVDEDNSSDEDLKEFCIAVAEKSPTAGQMLAALMTSIMESPEETSPDVHLSNIHKEGGMLKAVIDGVGQPKH